MTDTPLYEIGIRLAELRRARGLSLEQVGAALRISCGTLGNVERGRTQPSLRLLSLLASEYQTTLSDLFATSPRSFDAASKSFAARYGDKLTEDDWVVLATVAHALCRNRV